MSSDTEANLCLARGEYPCDSADPNICGPCQKLYELEEKIKEVKRMLAGLDNERQKLKEQANHTHDRLIHRLPLEVAGYVFELCIPEGVADLNLSVESVSRYDLCAPFILSAVCRRWRIVALSTPQLWTTIPLSAYQCGFPGPLIVKEWIRRTGQLPLSINLRVKFEPSEDQKDIVWDIINVLNQHSNRWLKITYEGPSSLLANFSNDKQYLPQLRTLSLQANDAYTYSTLELHPTRLNSLSICGIKLALVAFDFHHLSQLCMSWPQLSECFEALRRAPYLTRCTFFSPRTGFEHEFPLPQNPILHSKLQYLKITSLHDEICECLSCPSLKSLALEFGWPRAQFLHIVKFLERSGCSLETLLLAKHYASATPMFNIGLLFQGIPSLRHLNIQFVYSGSSSKNFFAHLAEFSIINGKKVPRYLPALSSLVVAMSDCNSWETILDVFGPPGPNIHSTECHRHALKHVKIFVSDAPQTSSILGYDFAEETARRIVWLRDVGVKWEVTYGGEDIIKLAVEAYGISSLGEVE